MMGNLILVITKLNTLYFFIMLFVQNVHYHLTPTNLRQKVCRTHKVNFTFQSNFFHM